MVRLGDVCDILNGYAFKSEEYSDSGFRIIRISNVQKGYVEDTTPVFYPEDNPIVNKYELFENDLLLSLTGNVGRVALLEKEFLPAALNQRVACLRPKKGTAVRTKYLFHILNSDAFEKACILSSKGLAQKNMSTEWLKDYLIPLPSLEKQDEISETLNKVDELISLRKKQLQKLDDLIKSRFVEMFGDPVDNAKRWPTKPLLEMGNCKNGMNFSNNETGIRIHCLGVGDFQNKTVITDVNSLPMISLRESPSKEYLLHDGDIVFVRSNGNKALVGRCVAVYPGNIPTTFSGFCIRYRKQDNATTIPYLLRVLKTDSIRTKMAGRGANIQNLNQQILGTLFIPIPPIDLQEQYAVFSDRVDKSKVTIQQGIYKLEQMKQTLMQKYFG